MLGLNGEKGNSLLTQVREKKKLSPVMHGSETHEF